jgi:ABC-type polysaccharide/polyol phosphate export permease
MNFFTNIISKLPIFLLALISPSLVLAASSDGPATLDMITSPVGIACLLLFIIAYGFVMAEEFTHFRKSKPVILAATVI